MGARQTGTDGNRLSQIVGILLIGWGASIAAATDRYWVAPIIGSWSDPANWSLSSGGPGGQGLPMGGDRVYLDRRSLTLFSGAGVVNPNFASLRLSGPFGGNTITSLTLASSAMGVDDIIVGDNAPRCELVVTNAQLVADTIRVGSGVNGTSATLRLDGIGLVDTLGLTLGDRGEGSMEFRAGTLRAVDVHIADATGVANLTMSGGTLDADTLIVGRNGDASLIQSGGDIDINTYTIGSSRDILFGATYDEYAEHTGGTLTAYSITVGKGDYMSDGRLTIGGGAVATQFLTLGAEDATGIVEINSGSLDVAGTATLIPATSSQFGDLATIEQTGGHFAAARLNMGEGTAITTAMSLYDMSGGTADHGEIYIARSPFADSDLIVSGSAHLTAGTIFMGEGSNADAFIRVENGTLECDRLYLGGNIITDPWGNARVDIVGGTLDADDVRLRPGALSATLRQTGGLFRGQSVRTSGETNFSGGITAIGSILGGQFKTEGFLPYPETSIRNDADFRTPDFLHESGTATIGPGTPTISGPVIGPPFNSRQTGDWRNASAMVVTAAPGTVFKMNINNVYGGSITVEQNAILPIDGTLTSINPIVLNRGTISSTNPIALEAGLVTGIGTLEADVTHSAELEPLLMAITGSMTCQADAVTRFSVGPSGATALDVGGDAALDGTIEIVVLGDQFLPPPGAEYELIAAGNRSGVFAAEVFSGASVPMEVVYEPARVLARVAYCSRADLAEPYGVLNFFDIARFIDLYQAQDPVADLAAPYGTVNFFDVSAFVSLYNTGCP